MLHLCSMIFYLKQAIISSRNEGSKDDLKERFNPNCQEEVILRIIDNISSSIFCSPRILPELGNKFQYKELIPP
jgi:hypothetical protein